MPPARWNWEYAWEITPDLIVGMGRTVLATLLGIVVALVLGLFFALGRRSERKLISYPVAWFVEFVRSTPLLVQLFFLFYAMPQIGFLPRSISTLSPLTTLVVGLGVHYACYCSEAYRAGINSVPKGQWEASTALNLKTHSKWRDVILPQAIPRALPPLGNYFVAMFKDAPQGAAITYMGVLFIARALQSADFRTVEPFTIAGILFLMVSIPAAMAVRRIERRVAYESD